MATAGCTAIHAVSKLYICLCLRGCAACSVDGGVGLMEGMGVTLVAHPATLDSSSALPPGYEPSTVPMVAQGNVKWIAPGAERAGGSYRGTVAFSASTGVGASCMA